MPRPIRRVRKRGRAGQFFVALMSLRGLTRAEIAWVRKHLSPSEEALFVRMSRIDQAHSLRVAKTAAHLATHRVAKRDLNTLIRAGLLHDTGKGGRGYGLVARVAAVVATQVLPERMLTPWFARPVEVFMRHPQWGAEAARRLGVEEGVVRLIRKHHEAAGGDLLLELLQDADQMA